MKIEIDKSESRGSADHEWLQTHYTFSFADYYNPRKMHFGALRVLNDDTIAPSQGFGMHPHKNMEVVSIPLKGRLRHGDSLQNSHAIAWGQIQIMSAGKGIYHSEHNDSSSEDLQLLQIWVIPEKTGTTPKYEDYDISDKLIENEITSFISPDTPPSLLQNAWFSWAILDKGTSRKYKLRGTGTGVYAFVVDGEIRIGDTVLSERDGAGITGTEEIEIVSSRKSLTLLIEVPLMAE